MTAPPRTARARRFPSFTVPSMERLFRLEFGPSRSKRFEKAVAEAQLRARGCSELEPDRYRAIFLVGADRAAYDAFAFLLERVRHWRASELYEGDEPVSAYQAKEMAWCASAQLKAHGTCRFRFSYGVFARCSLCPLFDGERAIRDVLGENPPPATRLELTLGSRLRALLRGELPHLDEDADPDVDVPDFLPEEWGRAQGEEPPD